MHSGVAGWPVVAHDWRMARRVRRKPAIARYSAEDLATATGVSVHRIRRDRRNGAFDPQDVRSLARYVMGLAPVSDVARTHYLALGVALGIGATGPATDVASRGEPGPG